MKAVPPVTLHRGSLGNCAKIIRANLIELGLSTDGLGSLSPYPNAVEAYFQALGRSMSLDLGSPGLYIKDINLALQPVRDAMVIVPPPPLVPPLFTGIIPDINGTSGIAITPYDCSSHFVTGGAVVSYNMTATTTGLAIDAGTGIISGTYIGITDSPNVVTGTNADGSADSNSFQLISVAPVIDMDGDGLPDTGVVGAQGDGNASVTQDADSYNIDTTGDDVADIVIPKKTPKKK